MAVGAPSTSAMTAVGSMRAVVTARLLTGSLWRWRRWKCGSWLRLKWRRWWELRWCGSCGVDVAAVEGGGNCAGCAEEVWSEPGLSAWIEGAVEGEAWRSRAAMLGDGAGVVAAEGSWGEEDVVWLSCARRRSWVWCLVVVVAEEVAEVVVEEEEVNVEKEMAEQDWLASDWSA
ncbi:unnamed protein product [Durusdinium trenchii]|uniref:Uncharacterized protein n=1 Tax=Durusdinium trenchii TaxID=1381693 RepID=A0ABP0PGV5_9DINO